MAQGEMQQIVGKICKKASVQSFYQRLLKKYESAGDKVKAERIRGLMANNKKDVETLRTRMNNQRQNNGMCCRWLTTKSKIKAYRGEKHDER